MGVTGLPIELMRVLTEVSDLDLQERLERVFLAAAHAINQLRELDLTQYENDTAEEAQSLELLEAVAPVLGATIVDVNAVVTAVKQSFPEGKAPGDRGEASAGGREGRAVEILCSRSKALHTEVMQLGIQLRSPRAVADRWNLLNHLQTARGRLRWGIGEMVADAASVYGEVSKVAVIPEYREDIDVAVGLRRTLHRFAVGLRSQVAKLESGSVEPLPQLTENLAGALDTLARTRTWRELRAPDKKEFVKFRSYLRKLEAEGAGSAGAATNAIKGFLSFLELLAAILNQRETLRLHDHACLAELTAQLEHVEGLAPQERIGEPMAKVIGLCDRLVGRDEQLDKFLKQLKEKPVGSEAQISTLREHAQRLLMMQS